MGLASKLATIQQAQGMMNQFAGTGTGAAGKLPLPGGGQQYGQPQQPQYGQGAYQQPPQQHGYGAPAGYGQAQQQQQHGAPPPQQGHAYAGPGATAPSAYSPYGGQAPGGQQYGAGAPPQPQYGAYPGAPPQQQPAYGGAGGAETQMIQQVLDQCIRDQKLQGFYPPGSTAQIAQRVAQSGALDRLARDWRLPKEVAFDCVKIALFDVILYLDDSGSMRFEEGGSRIDDLKLVLGRVAYATSLFDHDGISVRFMNSAERGDNLTNEQQAASLIQRITFSGLTPLGTSMEKNILQPLVLGPARAGQLRKPILIITVTDGAPAGEQRWQIVTAIRNAVNELGQSRYGRDALSFQFAQVGNDMGARDFLQELDANPEIGPLIDCTSNYELEADQARKTSGVDLSPELWLVKLLLGPIDSSYDSKDEHRQPNAPHY